MNYYNQTISTTTDYDALGVMTGYSVEAKSYNYFDLIILITVPVIFFYLIKWFRKLFR